MYIHNKSRKASDGFLPRNEMYTSCTRHHAGTEQQEIAEQARAAIFDQKERAFRCTLTSLGKDGTKRWTLYEMWPCMVGPSHH